MSCGVTLTPIEIKIASSKSINLFVFEFDIHLQSHCRNYRYFKSHKWFDDICKVLLYVRLFQSNNYNEIRPEDYNLHSLIFH